MGDNNSSCRLHTDGTTALIEKVKDLTITLIFLKVSLDFSSSVRIHIEQVLDSTLFH